MEEAWKNLKRFHCRNLTRPIPVPLTVGGPICGNEIRAPALIGIFGRLGGPDRVIEGRKRISTLKKKNQSFYKISALPPSLPSVGVVQTKTSPCLLEWATCATINIAERNGCGRKEVSLFRGMMGGRRNHS